MPINGIPRQKQRQIIKHAKLGKKEYEELGLFMGCTPNAIKHQVIIMQNLTPKKRTPASAKAKDTKRKTVDGRRRSKWLDRLYPVKKAKTEKPSGIKFENWEELGDDVA
ncbi:hypothetical protein AJ79_00221 [Helicocarpus griseus UAMH5409]|uniref:Uncharacterized protein n=1 Tax=Helicocarpus griseus UAMH5409 TaxID=1447875 RepID=A0A2B7YD25_9EURO|nr:hypothetical protein AJ79_00221 [Helicocarpus griseus UAMH5409]